MHPVTPESQDTQVPRPAYAHLGNIDAHNRHLFLLRGAFLGARARVALRSPCLAVVRGASLRMRACIIAGDHLQILLETQFLPGRWFEGLDFMQRRGAVLE